jgi:hypothetical protein
MSRSATASIGGPTPSTWREEMLTRVEELSGLESLIRAQPDHNRPAGDMFGAIREHLHAAKLTAEGNDAKLPKRVWYQFTGSSFERALGNLDAVEVHLLRLAPSPILKGALPSIQAHVNRFLPKDDPRRLAVDNVASRLAVDQRPTRANDGRPRRRDRSVATDDISRLGDEQRDVLIGAQHAANTQRRRDLIRVRSFRNLLLGGILVFAVIAIVLGFIGQWRPTTIPLCFTPEEDGMTKVVCPNGELPLGQVSVSDYDFDEDIANTVTSDDVWLVEFVGLLAAALAGAITLRKLKTGTSTPYAVPVALATFKLPTGAVTAVVGLLLMRADFVPGLSALDSSAQILGWAVVFGIAQQLVTRFADSQASGLLENVGGRGAAGDRPLTGQQPE